MTNISSVVKVQNAFQLLFSMLLFGCHSVEHNPFLISNPQVVVIYEPRLYSELTILDKDVILYPGALLQTGGTGKIIFLKKVTIIGETQVFNDDVNVEFKAGTLSALNPCWFGARGDDDVDDTKALQKTLAIAKQYAGSVNIEIPLGKYLVSSTLEMGNVEPNQKSINLIGKSMSNNGMGGSSFQWIGPAGGILLRIQNYCVGKIENMDFTKGSNQLLKYNVELKPFDYNIVFESCSFSGCGGSGSANVNINYDNPLQVSEIYFDHCIFRGYTSDGVNWDTESAVIGGYSNTKDFYFNFCSLLGYNKGAIDLGETDILKVENCTFAFNAIDISCHVCNTLATSNYSEHSGSFFKSGITNNVSFTTLTNNCFYGSEDKDYIIPQGGGHLVMINNNFGGMGGEDVFNKISWDTRPFSSIYSIGNFFRNAPPLNSPFEFSGPSQILPGQTYGDLIGRTLEDIQTVKPDTLNHQQ